MDTFLKLLTAFATEIGSQKENSQFVFTIKHKLPYKFYNIIWDYYSADRYLQTAHIKNFRNYKSENPFAIRTVNQTGTKIKQQLHPSRILKNERFFNKSSRTFSITSRNTLFHYANRSISKIRRILLNSFFVKTALLANSPLENALNFKTLCDVCCPFRDCPRLD